MVESHNADIKQQIKVTFFCGRKTLMDKEDSKRTQNTFSWHLS